MRNRKAAAVIEIQPNSGHWLAVPDRYVTDVGDFLATRYEGTRDGQARAVQRSLLDENFLSAKSAWCTFPAVSLTYAMHGAAKLRQVPITTILPHLRYLPMPVRSSLTQNPLIGDFIHGFDAGMIEYGGNLTKAQIVAEVCMAFPRNRVLVVSSHRHELRRISEALPRYAPFVGVLDVPRGEVPIDVIDVESAEDSDEIKSCQLVLSTPTNAGMLGETTGTELGKYPIVICLDATRVKDLMTSHFLTACHSEFRIFGLRHIDTPFQGEAADQAHNVFGPVGLRISESGYEPSETSFTWLTNPRKLRNLPQDPKPVDVLRLIPLCTERNNLVTGAARALTDGGRFQDDELVQRWPQTNQIERPTVVIIVRTFTQAARLVGRLPDWHVFRPDASADLLVGIKSPDRNVILDRSVAEPGNNRIICPLDYLGTLLAHVDPQIIVQASGGLRAPRFPATWFRHPAGTQRQRLVIDVYDFALPITSQISEGRFADYEPPDFLPVDLKYSRKDQSLGLPLLAFINRTFKPAGKRKRQQ